MAPIELLLVYFRISFSRTKLKLGLYEQNDQNDLKYVYDCISMSL